MPGLPRLALRGTVVALLIGTSLLLPVIPSGAAASFGNSLEVDEAGQPRPAKLPDQGEFVPGQLLVRFRSGVGGVARSDVLQEQGATREENLLLPGLHLVRIEPGTTVQEAVEAFESQPEVRYAEPNFIRRIQAIPNDTRFAEMWGLHNTGQTVNGIAGTFDADIDAPEAWDTETGSAVVVVAVLDTGLAYDHPDLAANVWSNPGETGGGKEDNEVDDDGNGFVDDFQGWDFANDENDPRDGNNHGTHVAGTIGALGNNATGVAGVNWDVAIQPVQICGVKGQCLSSDTVDGIVYAGANGASVANMSVGDTNFSQAERDAIAAAPDTLFVAAAGNETTNNDMLPQYPCNHPVDNIICVAASTNTDTLASFSNLGAESVDLAAPGDEILSTVASYETIFFDDFEGAVANWDYVEGVGNDPAKWERTTEASGSPTHSLTDSEGGDYANSANVSVGLLNPLDLSEPPPPPRVGVLGQAKTRTECRVDYALKFEIESFSDSLTVEAANFAGGPWTVLDSYDGVTQPPGAFGLGASDLGAFEGDSEVFLRFRLFANGDTDVFDGAHVDDVRVMCPSSTYAGTEYEYFSGTSMATPHVAGAAALLKAKEPTASPGQLKAAILSTVDLLPAFADKTLTGGRLNVSAALAAIGTTLEPPPSMQAGLDSTFGTDGKVTTPIGAAGVLDKAYGVAVQGDGKIVMVGRSGNDFAVVRYNTDGSLDPAFDGDSGTGNGVVTTTVGNDGAAFDEAHAVAIQPGDGKIVVVGLAQNTFFDGDDDFGVVRYNTDGTLDTTFSDNGIAFADNNFDQAWAVAIQPADGKIVVAGKTGAVPDSMLARFNADGTLDAGFNDTDNIGSPPGVVETEIGAGTDDDEFHGVALQGDGKIVATGFVEGPFPDVNNNDFTVARYNANGTLDTTFDGDGIAITSVSSATQASRKDQANAVVIQSDGKIVAAGKAQVQRPGALPIDRFALVRYNANGTLDETFSGDGKVMTSVSPIFGASQAFALGLQGDGKLVAAGVAADRAASTTSLDYGLARYNTDGTLDKTFNGDGKLTTAIAVDPEEDTARGLALLPGGGIVAGGWSDVAAGSSVDFDFSLVRYKIDGDAAPPPLVRLTDTDPDSPANDNTPMIKGSAEAGSTVNLYTTSDCSGPAVATGSAATFLTTGFEVTVGANSTTTFRATATDVAGNTSACSTDSITYVADNDPPETTIDSGPVGLTNDNTPTFTFSSDEGGSTFECRVTPAVLFAPCTSPHTTDILADGSHTFEVRATDPAGNTDASPASRAFTVDTDPPETTIDSGPSGPTNDNTPTFTFSSDEGSSTFQCRVDSDPFAACTSPHTTAALIDGPHTFEVRATDPAGNTDASPASRAFTVDTDPPETTIDSGPSGLTNDNTPMFTFSSDEGSSTFQCRVDLASFSSCNSPHTTAALTDGPHTFEVRAMDLAGNTDLSPANRAFTVETPPPPPPPAPQPQARDLLLKAKPKKVEKGDKVTLTGTLTLCTPGSVIEFQKKKGDAFVSFASVTTGDDCNAKKKVKVRKKTKFGAEAPAETGYLEAASNLVTVKVKPPS